MSGVFWGWEEGMDDDGRVWIWDYNQMKIAVILVVILVLISAETIAGKDKANGKEVAHHDNAQKTEEKANKQLGHGKAEVKRHVENDHEKKNTHVKGGSHQNSKGKKKAHTGKFEASHTANHKGSTKTTAHSKDAKNHSPAKKSDKKSVHPHQAKGKDTHTNKKVVQNHKAKNVPHKVSPKRQFEKIIPNDKTKQHLVSTNNPIKHIQANQTVKVVKEQQKPHTQSISNVSNETALKEASTSVFNSSEIVAKGKEETNTSIATPLLSSQTKEAGNNTVNEQQESSTESEEDSDEEQSSDTETQKKVVAEGNTTQIEQVINQTTKQDNPVQIANKTQAKLSAPKEDNSTLIEKEINTSKAFPEGETNHTKAQLTHIKQEKFQANKTQIQETPIKQEANKTVIINADLPKPQINQSLPKQKEAHTSVTTKKDSQASHQKAKSNFHTKVQKKTDTITIDASAQRQSQKTQKIIPPAQTQKHQAVEAKKDAVQQKPVQTKVPQPERHLKVTPQDDIDKLLNQVSAQKAKQKSKIADQIIDLQVKLHQQPTKEDTSLTPYIIIFFLAILIAVPIIKCLTKTNNHPDPGQRIVQFQEEDFTRLSSPQSGENLEEMI